MLAALAFGAQAAPPEEELPQAPGYYRQKIGDLLVTALFDGVVPLPRAHIVGMDGGRVSSLLEHRYVPETEKGMQTAINAYLVQRGEQLVLVDAGTATCFGAELGHAMENLRQSGYRPEEVDAVLLTHAHPDHLCGLLDAKGDIAYPNATVWLAKREFDHWHDAKAEAGTPEAWRFLFGMAQRSLAPYAAVGRLRLFQASDALPAGVTVVPSPGHTPGHSSYLVDAGSHKLLVWGDVLHYHAVQFAAPEASYEVDVDRATAIASRRNLLGQAARHGWWVAGAHLPFPGIGHVRTEGQAYAWVPVEFSPLPLKR